MMTEVRLAAGVVIYRPEAEVLRRQITVLEQDRVPVFACLNSGLDDAAQGVLDASVPPAFRLGDGQNRGLGAGLNLLVEAASAAGFTHLLLFDQDSEPAPGMAAALLAHWARRSAAVNRLAGIGPSLVPPEGAGYRPIRYQPTGEGHEGLVPLAFLPTSGTLIGLSEAQAIGPFRADYFIDGIDVEWGLRASSLGYVSLLAQDVAMLHRWGEPGNAGQANIGKAQILRLSPLRRYYYLRNAAANLRLGFAPLRWRLETAARLAMQVAVLILRGQGRGVMRAMRDGWTGRLGPAPDDIGGAA